MALDEDLSKMKDEILTILPDVDCDVTKDRLNFFVWELNFLDSFLCLRSFAFAGECGMLHVIQKYKKFGRGCMLLSTAQIQKPTLRSSLLHPERMSSLIQILIPSPFMSQQKFGRLSWNSELNTPFRKYHRYHFQPTRMMIFLPPNL